MFELHFKLQYRNFNCKDIFRKWRYRYKTLANSQPSLIHSIIWLLCLGQTFNTELRVTPEYQNVWSPNKRKTKQEDHLLISLELFLFYIVCEAKNWVPLNMKYTSLYFLGKTSLKCEYKLHILSKCPEMEILFSETLFSYNKLRQSLWLARQL